MALIDEAVQVIRAYVVADIARTVLEDWLAERAQSVADEHDSELNSLVGYASCLLAELGYGHRTEPEVRSELAAFVTGIRVSRDSIPIHR